MFSNIKQNLLSAEMIIILTGSAIWTWQSKDNWSGMMSGVPSGKTQIPGAGIIWKHLHCTSGSWAGVTERLSSVGLYTVVPSCGPSMRLKVSSQHGGNIPRAPWRVLPENQYSRRIEQMFDALWPRLVSSVGNFCSSLLLKTFLGLPRFKGEDMGPFFLWKRCSKQLWGFLIKPPHATSLYLSPSEKSC